MADQQATPPQPARDALDAGMTRELEEAEARRDQEWRKKGNKVTWWIGGPVALLALWAGAFLLTYQPPTAAPPKGAEATALPVVADQDMDPTTLSPFATKKVEAPPGTSPLIDKGDINFAMQLLNFLHDPPPPKEAEGAPPAAGPADRGQR